MKIIIALILLLISINVYGETVVEIFTQIQKITGSFLLTKLWEVSLMGN